MSLTDSKRDFAVEVVRRLQEAGHRALWAGGCVRDFLLGRNPQDYDVATDAHPEQVRELFGKHRTRAVGASFGVILVHGPKAAGDVEVATFRTEGEYLDGRRPESVEFTTPEEDAQRRDFTINGVFYDPLARQVLDFVGGEKDLAAGIVRAIGEPHDRMREDKLRMLRAVRFAATLEFELDTATADAIREMSAEMHVVSAERIAQELRKMLVDRHRKRAMELAVEVGLLPLILPELAPLIHAPADSEQAEKWRKTLSMLSLLQEPSFELAMSVLLHGTAGAPDEYGTTAKHLESRAEHAVTLAQTVGRRLKLSNQEHESIGWLLAHEYDLVEAPSLAAARLKRLFSHVLSGQLLALMRVETLARNADMKSIVFCEEYLQRTPPEELNPPPIITGDDLVQIGLKPGRAFRELLEAARDAQLNGEIHTHEQALELIKKLQTAGDK